MIVLLTLNLLAWIVLGGMAGWNLSEGNYGWAAIDFILSCLNGYFFLTGIG